MDIREIIQNDFLKYIFSEGNKQIDETSFYDYLLTKTKNELIAFVYMPMCRNSNMDIICKLYSLRSKKKIELVNFIIENLDFILSSYLEKVDLNTYRALDKIVSANTKNNIFEYQFENGKFTLYTILFLHNFLPTHIYYEEENNIIKIYIFNECKEIIKKMLSSKKIQKQSKINNQIIKCLQMCFEVYGFVSIDIAYKIATEKCNIKINEEHFCDILPAICNCNGIDFIDIDGIIYMSNGGINLNDDFDTVMEIINNDVSYKLYSEKEMKDIFNHNYFKKMKEYSEFWSLLNELSDDAINDKDYIDDFIIADYLYSSQLSIETARNNFMKSIDEFLEYSDVIQKNRLCILLEKLFKNYPKWKNKGNV